jgi:hypothetical protein
MSSLRSKALRNIFTRTSIALENVIKLHKAQLFSDRMSCHNATVNQVGLVLHTAAFWLMHGVRVAIPQTSSLAKAEFATIRERLIKIGARVIERHCSKPLRSLSCRAAHEQWGRGPDQPSTKHRGRPPLETHRNHRRRRVSRLHRRRRASFSTS